MKVGQKLVERAGFKLFHNHIAIEMVAPCFSYGSPEGPDLVGKVRRAFFDAFAAGRKNSYVFTFVWAFGEPGERNVEWSDRHVREHEEKYRCNSANGELAFDNYLRVDNTARSVTAVAEQIGTTD